MVLHFRHDVVRSSQKELMQDIYDSISNRQNFMAQAPTGSGKTDASISAALSYALENDLTVFFLTPKISQHKIAIDVATGIAKKHKLNIRSVDILGRAHCCIDNSLRELDADGFQSACMKKRKDKTCPYYINAHGYSRLDQAKAETKFKAILGDYGSGKGHHELIDLGKDSSCCPYEWLLKLGSISNLIVADYYHLLVPHIQVQFLSKIKKSIDKSIVIVDEAHNLSARIRSSLSRRVSSFSFSRAAKELRALKFNPGKLDTEFDRWAENILKGKKEIAISMEDFHRMIEGLGVSSDELAMKLEEVGLEIIMNTGKKSSSLHLAHFLNDWPTGDQNSVRILKTDGKYFFLSKKTLDPSPATGVLNDFYSSVLMSGTLVPLHMHRDVLGLDPERTIMKTYSSPFSESNTVNIITRNITTKYSSRGPQSYLSIAKKIDAIVSKTPGGSAIFFPSYKVMNEVLELIFTQNLHIQKPDMKPADIRQLIKNFKHGGVLCGVQGGSLSEGVDYCDGEIKTIIIVGLALDEMSLEIKALIDYYDQKFGRGWDYGYLYPGTLKALQAAGRALRKETDRVAVVYMDERFNWPKYNIVFDKKTKFLLTNKPEELVDDFWKNKYHL
ncbi:MAG: ATP-dependent DNA helicase [Candidatus Micrarchaeota archaeon]